MEKERVYFTLAWQDEENLISLGRAGMNVASLIATAIEGLLSLALRKGQGLTQCIRPRIAISTKGSQARPELGQNSPEQLSAQIYGL